MTPWTLVDQAVDADGTRHELLRRGAHFSIRVNGELLMNTRVHDSEIALAEMALGPRLDRERVRVLVGGLGFGYTLAAALARVGPEASISVAEIAPAVIKWNRELLAEVNGGVLADGRVAVLQGDICDLFRTGAQRFDAILLDVDNGPRAVGRKTNGWLYSPAGLEAIHETLNPGGVLAIWSAGPEVDFSERLRAARFGVVLHRVQSHRARTKERHFIWLATKGS
jgi:spermidine synthase